MQKLIDTDTASLKYDKTGRLCILQVYAEATVTVTESATIADPTLGVITSGGKVSGT